ncbi:hypothetical protein I79_010259 [Cricetulus griseus]|uniref:Uncharacterized protein n=1 Tax=Cricetulus griseus TaxID=10029 RepID=G3HHZ7_CRIGR|nr:hypothetical protein I79_010259 [Cricetulus griseus]
MFEIQFTNHLFCKAHLNSGRTGHCSETITQRGIPVTQAKKLLLGEHQEEAQKVPEILVGVIILDMNSPGTNLLLPWASASSTTYIKSRPFVDLQANG